MDSVANCPGIFSPLPLQDVTTDEVIRRGETTSSTSPSTCLLKPIICCARLSQPPQMP